MSYSNNKPKSTLVFLPGWGYKASIWQTIANQFSDYPVILLDIPDIDTQPESHENYLNDILANIDKQLPHDCVLIAWSLSGLLAANLCYNFPEKYKKLVTVASSPKFVETIDCDWPGISQTTISNFYIQAQNNLPRLLQKFRRLIHSNTAATQHHSTQQSLLTHLELLMQSDMREIYQQINIPVLHILGDKDNIIPPHCGFTIQQKYTHHTTHIIHGAGHMPFISHEREFMRCLLNFLGLGRHCDASSGSPDETLFVSSGVTSIIITPDETKSVSSGLPQGWDTVND